VEPVSSRDWSVAEGESTIAVTSDVMQKKWSRLHHGGSAHEGEGRSDRYEGGEDGRQVVCKRYVVAAIPRQALSAAPQLTVSVIDVGQGDSILVQFPYRENMLIDRRTTGRRKDGVG